ncbi:MAG TPA: HEPN domain-containing protein [Tepidisphaeraceae bacterium]|nr:HEPN domain-containing protein [Tepidisphaeraceae bacterium]
MRNRAARDIIAGDAKELHLTSIQKQTAHWLRSSRQDMQVGKLLLRQRKTRHALFFLHLAMEKLLKAMVCKTTQKPAPHIHSLPILATRASAILNVDQMSFLAAFDRFNLAARYPDDLTPMPRMARVTKLAREFTVVYRCLAKQL